MGNGSGITPQIGANETTTQIQYAASMRRSIATLTSRQLNRARTNREASHHGSKMDSAGGGS